MHTKKKKTAAKTGKTCPPLVMNNTHNSFVAEHILSHYFSEWIYESVGTEEWQRRKHASVLQKEV